MAKYRIFLSHTYEERHLAEAFKNLLETLSNKQITAWYSSDPRPSGGTELGDWRKQIDVELNTANKVIAIITPESNTRPWIAYETGYTHGIKKLTTPLFFFMKREQVLFFDSNLTSYQGSDPNQVYDILNELFKKADFPMQEPEKQKIYWTPVIEDYLEKVRGEEEKLRGRQLFQDHFHDAKLTEAMENKTWYAAWVRSMDDGSAIEWSRDQLTCWSTHNRIRFVGEGVKSIYPMEGVRSRIGYIALSYWSAGQIPICGTVLMKPNLSGMKYTGTWSGHSAETLDVDTLKLVHGRVFMTLDQEERDAWLEEHTT